MDSTCVDPKNLKDFEGKLNDDISGKKIAIIDNFLKDEMQEEVRDAITNSIKALEKKEAILEEIEFPYGKEAISVYHIISYGQRVENPKNMDELFKKTRTLGFGREAKRRIMLGTYVLSAGYYDAYYKKALKVRQIIIEKMNEIFAKYDAILMPVTIKTAPKSLFDPVLSALINQEETFYSDIYTCLANITGIPAISVPVSKDNENMPIGMQLLCNRYEDDKLLNIANVLFKEMN